jgi:hypothetical protein
MTDKRKLTLSVDAETVRLYRVFYPDDSISQFLENLLWVRLYLDLVKDPKKIDRMRKS